MAITYYLRSGPALSRSTGTGTSDAFTSGPQATTTFEFDAPVGDPGALGTDGNYALTVNVVSVDASVVANMTVRRLRSGATWDVSQSQNLTLVTGTSNYTLADLGTAADWQAGDTLRLHLFVSNLNSHGGAKGIDLQLDDGSSFLVAPSAPATPNGSASGTFSFSGTAAGGTTTHSGSATGTSVFAGTASGSNAHAGSASGTDAFTGVASGTSVHSGSATGATDTWAGSASGTTPAILPNAGSASGTSAFTGAGSGSVSHAGSASGTDAFSGTANGSTAHSGAAEGTSTFTGAADGTTPVLAAGSGSASGTFAFPGNVSGSTFHSGSATGSDTFTGTGVGSTPHSGSATGTSSFTGSADGTAAALVNGSASGSFSFVGDADGITTKTGNAEGASSFNGTASGQAVHDGDAEGTFLWAGEAEGFFIQFSGSAEGAFAFDGEADGIKPLHRFVPPSHEEPIRTNVAPVKYFRLSWSNSIVRINGVLTTFRTPPKAMLEAAGDEGTDWFRGGHVYFVDDDTAGELISAGFMEAF